MGLDMYLRRKIYVKNWEHTAHKDRFKITIEKGGVPYTGINMENVTNIVEEVGHWRKFNALHHWIVENIQNGEDNCREYHFDNEALIELSHVLQQLKDNPELAFRIFPTSEGFFFGSTEYDEYYWENVEYTIELINNLLEAKTGDIYYQASW